MRNRAGRIGLPAAAAVFTLGLALTLGASGARGDGGPVVMWIAPEASVVEGDQPSGAPGEVEGGSNTVHVPVYASRGDGFWDAYVDYTTADGSATAAVITPPSPQDPGWGEITGDYFSVPSESEHGVVGVSYVGPQDPSLQVDTADVTTVADTIPERDETFYVNLSNMRFCVNVPACRTPNSDEGIIGSPSQAVVTIVDDDRDKPGDVWISGGKYLKHSRYLLYVSIDSGAGTLKVVDAKVHGKPAMVETAKVHAAKSGEVRIRLDPSDAAKRALKHKDWVHTKVVVTYKTRFGQPGKTRGSVRLLAR